MIIKLYKGVSNNHTHLVKEDHFEFYDEGDEYIAASEPVDVDFKMIDENEVSKKEIACIDSQIKTEMAESEVKINRLKQQKQELLSIEFNGDSNDTNI